MWLVIAIVLIGLILRAYHLTERFEFAGDGDLYSWIVKDVVVNHHLRLIGQETSTSGIFIGPLFYYLLIPFFLINKMDPIGGAGMALFLSALTLLSFYFIFNKLFNKTTALTAIFLQAVLISRITNDMWVVPTVTSSLWEIWYFFSLVMLIRGNYQVLPLLGLLAGLIWHINFSLAPAIVAVPVAMFLARKLPTIKQFLLACFTFIVPSISLFVFEFSHGFIQTSSFIKSFLTYQGGSVGSYKIYRVLESVSGNAVELFLYPFRGDTTQKFTVLTFFVILAIYLYAKKIISRQLFIVLCVWFMGVVGFFSISSKIISEYYFNNITTIFLIITILFLGYLAKVKFWGRILVGLICLILLFHSGYRVFIQDGRTLRGYLQRKQAAQFIASDAKKRGFPCVSVSYITTPGENVGFRYFFFLENLHVNQPISGSPNYTIVIPANLYNIKPDVTVPDIGIITPKGNFNQKDVDYSCSGQNSNLTDPLFGYTN